MTRHRRNPKAIAHWRHAQIEDALATPTSDLRGPVVRAQAKPPVVWPNGRTRPISLATLYRWVALFREGGLAALRPVRRKDAGRSRAKLPADVLRKALSLFVDDPEISYTFLLALLRADPQLRLAQREITISRSTLQRRLAADPGYARLKRAHKLARRRRRYVGRHLHDIWHLDAKGPITLSLTSGVKIAFHVLTVLEDVSRAVLAAIVALTPDLAAAVRAVRLAARRWGLCDRFYADRAAIFDTPAFRSGLAQLGVHRIHVRSHNPEANGKIEAYHRVLAAWFTSRLPRQRVVDLEHLQQLLNAFVETLYQDHRHRGLASTPRAALGDTVSPRQVPSARIDDAFLQERVLKAHPKTGEVDLPQGTYLVPDGLRGQRLTFLVDPELRLPPLVVESGTARHLPLERAAIRAEAHAVEPPPLRRWGEGPLQTLYDAWQGKVRPVAEPGFGLPEIFTLLADATGRPVPRSDAEAALIQHAYRRLGPLPKRATESAFRAIRRALGRGRPVQAYLDALAQRVTTAPAKPASRPRRRLPR
jgi:transposase InsO family protein